jgi:hypothetical protein
MITADGIRYNTASHRKLESQKFVALTPAINCACFALMVRSTTGKIMKLESRNSSIRVIKKPKIFTAHENHRKSVTTICIASQTLPLPLNATFNIIDDEFNHKWVDDLL